MHILPFSDFEPLPLYNYVHIPGGSYVANADFATAVPTVIQQGNISSGVNATLY